MALLWWLGKNLVMWGGCFVFAYLGMSVATSVNDARSTKARRGFGTASWL